MRVLLVEPDSVTAQSVELMLRSEGFVVEVTDSGEDAIDLARLYDYDIVLTEIGLIGFSGFDVIRTLRTAKVKTPVMVVSSLGGVEDRVRGLGYGADDYLTKPFHKDELIARIHAIVRRSSGHAGPVISVNGLSINLDRHSIAIDGVAAHLTGKEFQILELLALRLDKVVTREAILQHLYGGMDEPELKIIDVFLCKVRRKFAAAAPDGRQFIETVWGRGYVMRSVCAIASAAA